MDAAMQPKVEVDGTVSVFVLVEFIHALERSAYVKRLPDLERIEVRGLSISAVHNLTPSQKPSCVRLEMSQAPDGWFYVLESERIWMDELPDDLQGIALSVLDSQTTRKALEVCDACLALTRALHEKKRRAKLEADKEKRRLKREAKKAERLKIRQQGMEKIQRLTEIRARQRSLDFG